MKAVDLAEMAARNLREALLRNTLTTLGIAVGVASLVAMLSLGVGLQQLVSKRLSRSGLFDTVFVTPRQNLRAFGPPVRPPGGRPEEFRPLDEAARHEIEQISGVVESYPEIRFTAATVYDGATHFALIGGLPASARARDAFEGMLGTFFSGVQAEEAILQMEFAQELVEKNKAEPAALLGKQIVLRYAEREKLDANRTPGEEADPGTNTGLGFSIIPREKKLHIVGIVESQPGSMGFNPTSIWVPLQFAQDLNVFRGMDVRNVVGSPNAASSYSNLTVRVAAPAKVPAVEEAIKQMGFVTFSLFDAARNLRRFFAILDLFLGIFGSLALAVASLGILNTLVMAILERRREIGILKALGAADRDVRQLFFAEAGAMGFVGGALGVLIGWGIGRAINFGTTLYLRRQQIPAENVWSVPWWLVLGAIGFAVAVSLVSGLYPAARAARLDPVQALRYE